LGESEEPQLRGLRVDGLEQAQEVRSFFAVAVRLIVLIL
jgi:hypothetical protein